MTKKGGSCLPIWRRAFISILSGTDGRKGKEKIRGEVLLATTLLALKEKRGSRSRGCSCEHQGEGGGEKAKRVDFKKIGDAVTSVLVPKSSHSLEKQDNDVPHSCNDNDLRRGWEKKGEKACCSKRIAKALSCG